MWLGRINVDFSGNFTDHFNMIYEILDISVINFSNVWLYLLEGNNSCRSRSTIGGSVFKNMYVLSFLAHANEEKIAKRFIALHDT